MCFSFCSDQSEREPDPVPGETVPKPFVTPLENVSSVVVMPKRGLVLSGHNNSNLSVWCARDGKLIHSLSCKGANLVACMADDAGDSAVGLVIAKGKLLPGMF